ncbi:hypothetical protein BO70DRAFT_54973 [Aspergillus heteromorphus CBS 117.55]|uniref:NAD(P)-binding protein n=1 Tax=Aspergillus heteromorphus CBS 117.55 TaxID=1448321 RepID=A0A317VXQ2_9EURO|nr:uncharacterized protein BO70DRAFT_54973 [Aspergillus heteromorphus CBS 117.55]PWY79134.1 hypothetical protein BO70DRAFT_54973 [Aspergillus heteromorphus CBS 117.55]
MLQIQVFVHLFRIAISLALLPLDNTILLAAYASEYIHIPLPGAPTTSISSGGGGGGTHADRRRCDGSGNGEFKARTVLITGINTPHGLALARRWYWEGYRVIGVDVAGSGHGYGHGYGKGLGLGLGLGVRSGGGKSRVLGGYYRIPAPASSTGAGAGSGSGYVARLVDVVQREKVDVWIPCSEFGLGVDLGLEDGAAKRVIEGRTECKCVTLDGEMAGVFGDREEFLGWLRDRGLPVVERHEVVSRDAIHKILHRSPGKVYRVRRGSLGVGMSEGEGEGVMLPKRTLSLTYSEVSEMQISREKPWVLVQQSRLGAFFAELVVVCGAVKAMKVYPDPEDERHRDSAGGGGGGGWGVSPVDRGLARAIRALVDRFAERGGPRMTGHLRLRLLVDEEIGEGSLRYVVQIDGEWGPETELSSLEAEMSTPPPPDDEFGLYQVVRRSDVRRVLPTLYPVVEQLDHALHEGSKMLFFWKNRQFSHLDPLPWWWQAHIYRPLRELEMIVNAGQVKRA